MTAATPRHAYSATRTAGGLAAIVPLGGPTRAHAHSLPGNLDAAAAKSASLPQKESIDAVRRPSLLTWAGGAPWLGGGHSFARPSAIAPHLAPSHLSPPLAPSPTLAADTASPTVALQAVKVGSELATKATPVIEEGVKVFLRPKRSRPRLRLTPPTGPSPRRRPRGLRKPRAMP